VALSDVANAMEDAARAWATGESVAFLPGNAPPATATPPALVWQFRPSSTARLTNATERVTGTADAEVHVAAGTGVAAAYTLAESLSAEFRGKSYAGADMLDEPTIRDIGRQGNNYRVAVSLPWEFDDTRIPQGIVGVRIAANTITAYRSIRDRWDAAVATPLGIPTYFDNAPDALPVSPPFALASFQALTPLQLEVRTVRIPGRLLVATNFPLGAGEAASRAASETIVQAFDQCSFDGLTFGTPSVTVIGRTPAETWQSNVRLPFHFEVQT